MTKIYFTRHGETQWNLEGRMQGWLDSPLTDLGSQQAQWLADRLIEDKITFDIVFSSSSGRAVQTAKTIIGNQGTPLVLRDTLREMSFGQWEGQRHDDVCEAYPTEHNNLWHGPHLYQSIGGESFEQVIHRTRDEFLKIVSAYEGKTILIVAHAIVCKALIAYVEDKPLSEFWSGPFMEPTCLNLVEIAQMPVNPADLKCEDMTLVLQGDVSHYKKD